MNYPGRTSHFHPLSILNLGWNGSGVHKVSQEDCGKDCDEDKGRVFPGYEPPQNAYTVHPSAKYPDSCSWGKREVEEAPRNYHRDIIQHDPGYAFLRGVRI